VRPPIDARSTCASRKNGDSAKYHTKRMRTKPAQSPNAGRANPGTPATQTALNPHSGLPFTRTCPYVSCEATRRPLSKKVTWVRGSGRFFSCVSGGILHVFSVPRRSHTLLRTSARPHEEPPADMLWAVEDPIRDPVTLSHTHPGSGTCIGVDAISAEVRVANPRVLFRTRCCMFAEEVWHACGLAADDLGRGEEGVWVQESGCWQPSPHSRLCKSEEE